jgi:hypothetical protein
MRFPSVRHRKGIPMETNVSVPQAMPAHDNQLNGTTIEELTAIQTMVPRVKSRDDPTLCWRS